MQFLRHQPDRDASWRGWLVTTAQREAWRLNAIEWRDRDFSHNEFLSNRQVDPRDRYEERIAFDAALQQLKKLPPEMQRVVLIRSQVWKQEEVAEVMGIRPEQVTELLRAAAVQVAEINQERHVRERPVASPRAARLRELEQQPPEWLSKVIGTCPARSKSSAAIILAWRRAALAIDDYRGATGFDDPCEAIGFAPLQPADRRAYVAAERAIIRVAGERERRKGGIER